MLKTLERWAVPGAILMAASWLAAGVVAFALASGGYGDVPSLGWYLIESAHAVGEAGLLLALVGVYAHLHQGPRSGHLERFGFWAAFMGTALMIVATVANIVDPRNVVAGVLLGMGMLGWLTGFPLLGIAALRTRALQRWFGWLLIAFFPLAVILHLVLLAPGVGGVVVALLWLLLAYGLWSQRGPTPSQTVAAPTSAPSNHP